MDRVQKRQSNVMKLTEQNEKLKEELRAMNARIEAAERRQQELRRLAVDRSHQDSVASATGAPAGNAARS